VASTVITASSTATTTATRQKVRYAWTQLDRDHARWEQALSSDGQTWETRWTADFTRRPGCDLRRRSTEALSREPPRLRCARMSGCDTP
jgi:hypothetical protein